MHLSNKRARLANLGRDQITGRGYSHSIGVCLIPRLPISFYRACCLFFRIELTIARMGISKIAVISDATKIITMNVRIVLPAFVSFCNALLASKNENKRITDSRANIPQDSIKLRVLR